MARQHAYHILNQYFLDDSYLNLSLNECLKDSQMSRQDKDLCTTIVYGTIQNLLYLQYQLEPYIQGKRVKRKIKTILLMSLYQMIFLDKIPEYAIINEAVSLAKKENYHAGQFVNGVLRNLKRNPLRSYDQLSEKEKLSIETSHPLWMINMFEKQYGLEKTIKICQEDNEVPSRSARVNTLKTTREELLNDNNFIKSELSKDGLLYQKGNIAQSEAFQKGYVTIQDESSQLVAPLLDVQDNDYVLDMCGAPGSKTTHLAMLMHNSGKIEVYDLYEHKIKLIEQNCQRLGVKNVQAHVYDATKLDELYPAETFDRILLDAPCSGLGVLKRKPEIKYHDSRVMDELIPIQTKLLEKAYYLLKNNGTMVYSTCTINKKENDFMIKQFIDKHADMTILQQKTILNYEYHSDGFFMCKMKKG